MWFFWFYSWEKVKPLLLPVGEIDGDFIKETLDGILQVNIQSILQSEELTMEEKEEAIADEKYIFKREFKGNYEAIAEDHRKELRKNILIFRALEGLLLAADSLLMLAPTLLLFGGYVAFSQIMFVVLGISGIFSISNTVRESGGEVTIGTRAIALGMFMITQAPYFVLWMFK